MDRIADEVVHSTENVEQGNEEIREVCLISLTYGTPVSRGEDNSS